LQKSIVGSLLPFTTVVLLLPFVSAGSVSLAALLRDRDCERDRLPWELDEAGLELPPISETIVHSCKTVQTSGVAALLCYTPANDRPCWSMQKNR
jgi:hypothetical protein